MSPAEADECELWQLAAVLGLDSEQALEDPLDALAARVAAEKSSLAERAAALPNAPPPPKPTDKPGLLDVTEAIKREMGLVG